jgi:hypothetical protein
LAGFSLTDNINVALNGQQEQAQTLDQKTVLGLGLLATVDVAQQIQAGASEVSLETGWLLQDPVLSSELAGLCRSILLPVDIGSYSF